YEEHLWNVTHGKGFRSYLDDGRLFLGEHVQGIHLLLIPFHLIWPSHLLLELCESLALASGAIPVFFLARRHTGSDRWGLCLAAAYLCSFPLHFLDIAVDLKTFRPISFGVPLMLFAIDQMERRRYCTMIVLLLFAVSAKEDFAVIVSLLGIWMATAHWRNARTDAIARREKRLGIGLAVCGAAYVLLVIKVVIPAFRGGAPHYAAYFGALGNTPGDIVHHLFTQPLVVLEKLFSGRSFYSALALLLPIGFLPLLSPGRLLVAAPLFGVLCLLDFSDRPIIPYHHFHAPLLPILFWSAAAGLGRVENLQTRFIRVSQTGAAHFALMCAVCSAAVLSYYPGSFAFWDSGATGSQGTYWQTRFVPGKRAELFRTVQALVPEEARVFSTDFIHTRFTHHRRSYDFSAFPRKSDAEIAKPVAGETYYIVIDTRSRYSKIRTPADVIKAKDEYKQHPEDWELIRHEAEEYFIVLKRR
ncbi:MAG: DUF2079 domain-containing protein, partial [Planctomycetes bacterium]|nr:DUF2079 domain-containing protein [Planctomycetota bacterium]